MDRDRTPVGPEDFAEPRCLLSGTPYGATPGVRQIPQQRIVAKLDDYMARKDHPGAERHLKYWLEEARLGRDSRGELLVLNEMIGFYRKTGRKEDAFARAEEALALLPALGYENSVSGGTTYVNAATAHVTFGEAAAALELFEKARRIYEAAPGTAPDLLGGLYNNMGLACVSLKQFDRARGLYDLAMRQMEAVPNGELEQAITCLNRANAIEAEKGLEAGETEIFALLDRAYGLLEGSAAPGNGYFAFVCETCAPTFSYYGYFLAAEELKEKAEQIYKQL